MRKMIILPGWPTPLMCRFPRLGMYPVMLTRLCSGAFLLGAGLLAGLAQQPVPPPAAAETVSVLTDRADATYHVGDTVTFKISVSRNGVPETEGSVTWSLSQDGVAPFQNGVAQ